MRQRRLKNEINVVPYIDVMLVLLVIFMVTAPMMTPGTVDIPSVEKMNQAKAKALEVIIDADESLALIDRSRTAAEEQVSRRNLLSRIKELQAKNPDQPVLIVGDKNVKYEAVLKVMDDLKQAEVKTVSLLVQPVRK